jgi:hypothetical protein
MMISNCSVDDVLLSYLYILKTDRNAADLLLIML